MPDSVNVNDLCVERVDFTGSTNSLDDLDLALANGDLALVAGVDNLKLSILRRLQTPLGYYGISVGSLDDNGDETIVRDGDNYGADLIKYMSQPMTNAWIQTVRDAIEGTLNLETRITVTDIQVTFMDPARGTVRFDVTYTIVDTQTEEQLILETSQEGLRYEV